MTWHTTLKTENTELGGIEGEGPADFSPELIQGPGVLPNRGDKSIYKRYTKIGL